MTGERAIDARCVSDLLSVMYTCGMYDFAGEWGYKVGLPAKSGVSGGIVAVVPGRMGIAVFSPPLDEHGNSVRGIEVFEALSRYIGLHIFDVVPEHARLNSGMRNNENPTNRGYTSPHPSRIHHGIGV